METERKIAEFNIGDMVPIALTFVIVGIVLVYGLSITKDVKDDMNNCGDFSPGTYAYNTTNEVCYNTSNVTHVLPPNASEWVAGNQTVLALGKIPAKLPLIATVAVAAIIIGLIMRYFMRKF